MTPFLDLRHIAIDPTLVQHLPPGLARFYEVIPVAREGDRVTVAMSHPENVTALGVLTQLFRAEIVPIRTNGEALRALLEQLYLREPAQPHGLLAWLPAACQPAWAELLAAIGLASGELAREELASEELIEGLAAGGAVTWLDEDQTEIETLLTVANSGNYRLTLSTLSQAPGQAALLREIHTPLWLVPADPGEIRRILLVLRGFASDEVALNWVIRLAASLDNPAVTLLPLLGDAPWGALSYLREQGASQAHVKDHASRLAQVGIQPTLTLQSGELRRQVTQAMRQGGFDLAVIAAEGHGHFVGQVLADLEGAGMMPPCGVLVLKPSHEQG
jgi:hypothetical protein